MMTHSNKDALREHPDGGPVIDPRCVAREVLHNFDMTPICLAVLQESC
jgi:hypothetical protein